MLEPLTPLACLLACLGVSSHFLFGQFGEFLNLSQTSGLWPDERQTPRRRRGGGNSGSE